MREFDPVALLEVLIDHDVQFIVIGGIAARLRGAPLLTQDIDITPANDAQNLTQLADALTALEAKLRTAEAPEGLAFPIEPGFLQSVDSWTLTTIHGDLDLVFMPDGTTGYKDLVRSADSTQIRTSPALFVMVASLADVIRSKQAAGRDKDRASLPLLRKTLSETDSHQID
ncbi:MAG: hypothetical protein R2823_04780 [Acidimicrobiia bacterium]